MWLCPTPEELPGLVLRGNAEIRIPSCMRTCPYCGQRHSNASRLQKHLRQRKYRERNIFIAPERLELAISVGHLLLKPRLVAHTTSRNDSKYCSPTSSTEIEATIRSINDSTSYAEFSWDGEHLNHLVQIQPNNRSYYRFTYSIISI